MERIREATRARPLFLKYAVIAVGALLALTLLSDLVGRPLPPEEQSNLRAVQVTFLIIIGFLLVAWAIRVIEIRMRGEAFLVIAREYWYRGETLRGVIELGFSDPVEDARIRAVQYGEGASYVSEPLRWSRASSAAAPQALSIEWQVPINAPAGMYMIEMTTRSSSGKAAGSSFLINVK